MTRSLKRPEPKRPTQAPARPKVRKRKAHANSTAALVQIAKDARVVIQPPASAGLIEKHMPYWAEIVASRTADEWADAVQLQLAAQLARLFAQAAEIQGVLDRDGLFLVNGDPHPGNRLLLEVGSKAQALMRSLQIAPNQTTGRAASNVNRREAERKARELDAERAAPPAPRPQPVAPARLIDCRKLSAEDLRHVAPSGLDLRPGSPTFNQIAFTRRERNATNV